MKLFILILLPFSKQARTGLGVNTLAEDHTRTTAGVTKDELKDIVIAVFETMSEWKSVAYQMPQALAYKDKITKILQKSHTFFAVPHLKEKLIKWVDRELQTCLRADGKNLDMVCLRRVTGYVMQLINALEKSTHFPANLWSRKYFYNDD